MASKTVTRSIEVSDYCWRSFSSLKSCKTWMDLSVDLELDVWGAEDLVVLLFADKLWEAEFLVGTDFVFDFVVFSLSWVNLCEPRMQLSPVDMFNCRWAFVTSVSPCVEVLADVTADCSILWPQSQQISTLRVRQMKYLLNCNLGPLDCNFWRNSAKFCRAKKDTSTNKWERICIDFWDRIVQSHEIPTLNNDKIELITNKP